MGMTISAGPSLDRLGVEVRHHASRPFIYTNKQDASYYGETLGRNRVSWQGFTVRGHEFLDDYDIVVNGTTLDRSSALNVVVYPDHLERTYPGGLIEEFWPVDSLAMVGIHLRSPRPIAAGFVPYFTDGPKAPGLHHPAQERRRASRQVDSSGAHGFCRLPGLAGDRFPAGSSAETSPLPAGRSSTRAGVRVAGPTSILGCVANTADQAEALVARIPTGSRRHRTAQAPVEQLWPKWRWNIQSALRPGSPVGGAVPGCIGMNRREEGVSPVFLGSTITGGVIRSFPCRGLRS